MTIDELLESKHSRGSILAAEVKRLREEKCELVYFPSIEQWDAFASMRTRAESSEAKLSTLLAAVEVVVNRPHDISPRAAQDRLVAAFNRVKGEG